MNLIAPSPALLEQLAAQLHERQAELLAQLRAASGAAMAGEAAGDVQDFKDVAAEDVRALIDDAAHAHAAVELDQVAAALRRVDAGTYGQCEDCGEAIDDRRLRAMPATRFCTACQALRERTSPRR
jgi:DnaK suppressor protein